MRAIARDHAPVSEFQRRANEGADMLIVELAFTRGALLELHLLEALRDFSKDKRGVEQFSSDVIFHDLLEL